MRFKRIVLTSILVPGFAVGAATLLGADEPDGTGEAQDRVAAPRGVSAALRRDLGLSAEQAREQGELQAKATKLERELQDSLGEAFAGSVYDERTGRLVVMVSDPAALGKVEAAGADGRLVKYGKAELDAIKEELDVAAGRAKRSRPTDRAAVGKRQALVAGMTTWHVDPESNTVRVTVKEGHAQAVEDALAEYGDAVTVEESNLAPTTTSRGMSDGGRPAPSSP